MVEHVCSPFGPLKTFALAGAAIAANNSIVISRTARRFRMLFPFGRAAVS
jgi:hypothetical protein